jgi:hypothetical protein
MAFSPPRGTATDRIPSAASTLALLADPRCLKREIRHRFPYGSYVKASIFAGLLALFGGGSFR